MRAAWVDEALKLWGTLACRSRSVHVLCTSAQRTHSSFFNRHCILATARVHFHSFPRPSAHPQAHSRSRGQAECPHAANLAPYIIIVLPSVDADFPLRITGLRKAVSISKQGPLLHCCVRWGPEVPEATKVSGGLGLPGRDGHPPSVPSDSEPASLRTNTALHWLGRYHPLAQQTSRAASPPSRAEASASDRAPRA